MEDYWERERKRERERERQRERGKAKYPFRKHTKQGAWLGDFDFYILPLNITDFCQGSKKYGWVWCSSLDHD